MPVARAETWFIIAPTAGIETQSTASAMALIGELAGPLHATLIAQANGVWVFRWRPPPGVHSVVVPDGMGPLPAWAAPGAAGRAVLTGPVSNWHVGSAGGQGYVCDGLAWLKPAGRYQASVTLSATGPVNVEVWDDNGDVLLARQSLPATAGVESITLPVNATTAYSAAGLLRVGAVPGRLYCSAPGPAARGTSVVPRRPGRQRLPGRPDPAGGHACGVTSAVSRPCWRPVSRHRI